MNNLVNSQSGGIIIKNKNPEQSFRFFIENSESVTLITTGSSGYVFMCKLNSGIESRSKKPYKSL